MKERGIYMNEFGVRGILDDRKTQHRHIMKNEIKYAQAAYQKGHGIGDVPLEERKTEATYLFWIYPDRPHVKMMTVSEIAEYAPYSVEDLLWVRETWRTLTDGRIIYRADYPNEYPGLVKWKSPFHMFKKYARIWLEVTDVRVERVQDITDADAVAEGCELAKGYEDLARYSYKYPYRKVFLELWDEIHGEDAWDKNDWVWVYEFERTEK